MVLYQRIPKAKSFFLLVFCFAFRALAQFSTAAVMGVVQDSSRASIPDATLKLINTQTGTENDSTTNNQGGFLLPGVIPGTYTLQIERDGFATTQVNGITLNLGDTRNLLIRMKVGSVADSVIVDASGLTLNTTDASVSTVVDQKFVTNVPLNGRSFQDLISLTPGIVTQSPQAAGQGTNTIGEFSVNGQQPESNSFFVDGVSANVNSGLTSGNSRIASTGSIAGTTALGTTQSLVSVDALQEFRVLSSTYSAEYGRTPGGQFTFLTRSGTSALHGSLFTYFRNSVLDAEDWFRAGGGPATEFNQYDFGGTLGGPIILPHIQKRPDQTFIFLSYEGLYLDQPTPQTFQYAPSFEIQQEAPAALQPMLTTFPPAGSEVVDTMGKPTGLAYLFFPDYALPSHVDATSVRLDHTFSSKLAMFFRYGDTPSYSQTRQLWSLTANQVNNRTFTLGISSQLPAAKSNEFRLGYAGTSSSLDTSIVPLLADFEFPPDLNTALGIPTSYSSVRAQAYIHVAGAGDTESDTDQATGSLHQWNVRDTFSLRAGNHLFNFGLDERHIIATVTPAALSVQADFFDRQSLAANLATDLVVTRSSAASPALNQFSAFAADEWKVSRSLNLSLGLRWEVNPPPKGKDGADAFTVLGDVSAPPTLEVAPRGTPLWHTTWFNIAPRIGAAWVADAQPGRESIVRAGGGVFSTPEINQH